MQKSFTHAEMCNLKGCYSEEKLASCSFMGNNPVTIEGILDSEIPTQDKLWFVYASCGLELPQKIWLSLSLAKLSAKHYNSAYPEDNRVNDCIRLTEQYLNGETTLEEVKEAARAARAASSAASAADAAYAAASAADAARAAAYAASSAADAAADAAASAAYAADAAASAAASAADAASSAAYAAEIIQAVKDFIQDL